MLNHDSIGFFYPTRSVGGAQYLFARMAEYLIERSPFEVVLIDYADGFIREKLGDRSYRFIEYRGEGAILTHEPLLLVLPLSYPPIIEHSLVLSDTTRLFFWDLHPYNLVEQFALSGFYKLIKPTNAHRVCSTIERSRYRKLVKFVDIAAANHGIAFMAEKNRTYNQHVLKFSSPIPYLPIPIDTARRESQGRSLHPGDTLHIGWLSRLDPWKTSVLSRLLYDVTTYERERGFGLIHVHIIGDGPSYARLVKQLSHRNITMVGRLEGESLTEYTLTNLHVGFAMGTSAMEFAIRGLPTVLTPDLIHDRLALGKLYRWLFDSQGYNLTAEEEDSPDKIHTFSDIVQHLRNSTVLHLGEQCRNHVVENHDIGNVGAMFVDQLSRCTLTYGTLQHIGLYQRSWAEHLLFKAKKVIRG